MSLLVELRQKIFQLAILKPVPIIDHEFIGKSCSKLRGASKAGFDEELKIHWKALSMFFHRGAYRTEMAHLGVSRKVRTETVFVIRLQSVRIDDFLSSVKKRDWISFTTSDRPGFGASLTGSHTLSRRVCER